MKMFFLLVVLGCHMFLDAEPAGAQWDSFKAITNQKVDDVREWLVKALGYGHDTLAQIQSVEMLPYRYVFLVSFLGGLTGALTVYYLYKASGRIARAEFESFTEDQNRQNDYPLTFRTID